MERRIEVNETKGSVELREEGESLRLSGYAAVFYNDQDNGTEYHLFGKAYERISPGAFRKSVKQNDIAALFNHDPSKLLGRTSANTLTLTEDDRGLRYTIDLPNTSAGRDVAESVRRGDLRGSSFGFDATNVNWERDGQKDIREIKEAVLYDVGPVTYPAYKSTNVDVRCEEAEREYEAWYAVEKEKQSQEVRTTLESYRRRIKLMEIAQ